ncbi:MAG: sulfotransferase [Saccharofermentanaceae bacterium]|nr:sulfotransferase [Bacteroidales bacterium]
MKDSYLTAGIKLNNLLHLLSRNPVSLTPKTTFRLLFLLQSSGWSSLFALVEKRKFARKLEMYPVPKNPVFIIGHWRTGSTLLHQFLSKDPNLIAPTLFQVAVPDSLLTSYRYYRPIFKYLVSEHRPMDKVRLGMDEPQEDEYAIYRTTGASPLEDLVFPKSQAYFLSGSDKFIPTDDQINYWIDQLQLFYKKLNYKGKKRIVSKNPFNSMRIPLLIKSFPEAKFIHIHRHPYEVIPSTIHMWDILQQQNSLNKNACRPSITEVTTMMDKLLTTIRNEFQTLPSGSRAEVRFDELEKNPVKAIRGIYKELGLDFTAEFERNIDDYHQEARNFYKNEFVLSPQDAAWIYSKMKTHMEHFGYH